MIGKAILGKLVISSIIVQLHTLSLNPFVCLTFILWTLLQSWIFSGNIAANVLVVTEGTPLLVPASSATPFVCS